MTETAVKREEPLYRGEPILSFNELSLLSTLLGDAYYLLDSRRFESNYRELLTAFRLYYPKTQIAYSYKTNYTPRLCETVNALGGYAEVVSGMEYRLARKTNTASDRIILNGPYKEPETIRNVLEGGGIVNIDSLNELEMIDDIASFTEAETLRVGIRCNFTIDEKTSRFGIDADSKDFAYALEYIRQMPKVKLSGMHCHFPNRSLESFGKRTDMMLELVNRYFSEPPEFLSLGGGFFGRMPDSLKKQFDTSVPSFEEYAETIAPRMKDCFGSEKDLPLLFIEPGTALAGDAMKFVTKVVNVKTVRDKTIATVCGSKWNINPTLNDKNLPLEVFSRPNSERTGYESVDIAGYTCIESDYLYKDYKGTLAPGDYLVFSNAGSYSLVLKPPFIMPNFAVIDLADRGVVKRREEPSDIFQTFVF